jgi:hypothetical protein
MINSANIAYINKCVHIRCIYDYTYASRGVQRDNCHIGIIARRLFILFILSNLITTCENLMTVTCDCDFAHCAQRA